MEVKGIGGVRRKIGIGIENLARCHCDVNHKIKNLNRLKDNWRNKFQSSCKTTKERRGKIEEIAPIERKLKKSISIELQKEGN